MCMGPYAYSMSARNTKLPTSGSWLARYQNGLRLRITRKLTDTCIVVTTVSCMLLSSVIFIFTRFEPANIK